MFFSKMLKGSTYSKGFCVEHFELFVKLKGSFVAKPSLFISICDKQECRGRVLMGFYLLGIYLDIPFILLWPKIHLHPISASLIPTRVPNLISS